MTPEDAHPDPDVTGAGLRALDLLDPQHVTVHSMTGVQGSSTASPVTGRDIRQAHPGADARGIPIRTELRTEGDGDMARAF